MGELGGGGGGGGRDGAHALGSASLHTDMLQHSFSRPGLVHYTNLLLLKGIHALREQRKAFAPTDLVLKSHK